MWRFMTLGVGAILCCLSVVGFRCASTIDTCVIDRDCSSGYICSSGTCTTRSCLGQPGCIPDGGCVGPGCSTGCRSSVDCKVDENCVNNVCKKSAHSSSCSSIRDCRSHEDCVNGYCKSRPGYCRSSLDCKVGEVCTNGTCDSVSKSCNRACLPSETCIQGRCQKNPRQDECTTHLDCTSTTPTCKQLGNDCLQTYGTWTCRGGTCLPEDARKIVHAQCIKNGTGGLCRRN